MEISWKIRRKYFFFNLNELITEKNDEKERENL